MSEIKQINTGAAELLAVKVPEGASEFDVLNSLNKPQIRTIHPEHGGWWYSDDLPPGNWTPLGLSTELTEEQCREVVRYQSTFGNGYYYGYNMTMFETAKESFNSFMKANECYTENPLQLEWDEACTYGHGGCSYEEYFSAQANTGKWLILKLLS